MIVVADTGPLHYLVLIGAVDVLQPLYSRVLVPQTVTRELQDPSTPATVRAWMSQPPEWCEIRPDPLSDPALQFLDQQAGRAEAERRHLVVTGTLGVLAEAHRAGLLEFESALARLQLTNFYLSTKLIDTVRRRLFTGEEKL